ncbi:MAG: hypothetical protein ACYDH6_19870 [Acidimicrobiales bacterium]
MTDPGMPPPSQTIRAERIEIVDQAGHVRLIVGDLGLPSTPGAPYGVAVLDDRGRQRLWIGLHDTGPALVVEREGNMAVQLGVDDDTPDAMHVGAYLHLANEHGDPAATWRVESDGSVTVHIES